MTAIPQILPRSEEFGPLTVRYDARVLAPRPWTLLQARWAAELAVEADAGPLLELCAGAGQIGLAAAVLSGRRLIQVEADPVAAGYARSNAVLAEAANRVEVRVADLESALDSDERFPIILADPPYLPSNHVAAWPEDPPTAIDGGADGLDLVRVCLQIASRHLSPGAALLLQVAGDTQARAVAALLETQMPLEVAHCETRHHDRDRAVMLLRRARLTVGRRPKPSTSRTGP
jgi:release factor glutamine methyltransferase